MATELAERYELEPYIRQRIKLIKDDIENIFARERKAMPGSSTSAGSSESMALRCSVAASPRTCIDYISSSAIIAVA